MTLITGLKQQLQLINAKQRHLELILVLPDVIHQLHFEIIQQSHGQLHGIRQKFLLVELVRVKLAELYDDQDVFEEV